ncbi:hypothetical protein [Corallococcus sp. AB030]|uniref:hypothetical protein n=1 Tax=Corallococcus sp. AB030 TaxID=2316716 RepID=UPI0011E5E601|nr:hypothetical protein [Corallococcus sp. AB030]
MNRLFALAVLLCVACGDKTDPKSPDAGTAGPSALIVHSDWWAFARLLPQMEDVTVLLGDGSLFRQPLGRDGIARFEGAATTRPQDITFVVKLGDEVMVSTALGVEGSEVWVRSILGSPEHLPSSTRQATLTGRVTNNGFSWTNVYVVGKGFTGHTLAESDGSFRLDVMGENPGKVALVVTDQSNVQKVGLLRDIAVGEGRTVGDLVLPMDHPVDQLLSVEVPEVQPYAPVGNVSASFLLGSDVLFTRTTSGAEPIELPVLARTPPFDAVEVRLSVAAGSPGQPGTVVANASPAPRGVTRLALPAPMTLTSPTPGTAEAPGSAQRSGLTVRWSADPAAHSVMVRLGPVDYEQRFSWVITAPATRDGFTLFTLPEGVAPRTQLGVGRHTLVWGSSFLGTGRGYQSLFKEAPAVNGLDAWETLSHSELILQD